MTNSSKHQRNRFGPILVIVGVCLCVFTWLLAIANSAWVVIRIPSLPWTSEPSFAAFEARLWGVMGVCFFLGVFVCGLIVKKVGKQRRRKAALTNKRLEELETELENVNRLVAATRKGSQ